VQRLARVLLEVRAGEAARLLGLAHHDREAAAGDHRLHVLADLVALREVGVEIILALEGGGGAMVPPTARPKRIALSTAPLFNTGSVPGIARSTAEACVLGGAPKAVEEPKISSNAS
jgi:hypothetical protein